MKASLKLKKKLFQNYIYLYSFKKLFGFKLKALIAKIQYTKSKNPKLKCYKYY